MQTPVYPGAIQRPYPIGNRTLQPTLDKLVLHSTETTGLPGYQDGYTAPSLTVDPWGLRTWQHFPSVAYSTKTLRDTGGFAENRDCVSQIEIIGYSDPARKDSGKFLPQLGVAGVGYLAEVIAWYGREWSIPLEIPALWPMYPASYGRTSARMSTATYDAYRGILGHLHVPDNAHGDPSLPIGAIMEEARVRNEMGAITGRPSGTAPLLYVGMTRSITAIAWTKYLQRGLLAAFPSYASPIAAAGGDDGWYGKATAGVVAEFQRRTGLLDDGKCGSDTWPELDKYGI